MSLEKNHFPIFLVFSLFLNTILLYLSTNEKKELRNKSSKMSISVKERRIWKKTKGKRKLLNRV